MKIILCKRIARVLLIFRSDIYFCICLMPLSTTGGTSRGEMFHLAAEPPPRSPHFVRVVHTAGGRPLIGQGFFNHQ